LFAKVAEEFLWRRTIYVSLRLSTDEIIIGTYCNDQRRRIIMAGYPDNYEWLESKFGKAFKTHQTLGRNLQDAGPIGRKNVQLIQLAAAAAIRSEGAVHSHVRRALEAKAKPAEIYHSLILLTSTIGFPAVAAALSWARGVIEKKK
jgi:alkylhydroperoxidase/carboxymuconolactone decarboxylase family protein YurZ